MHKAHIYGVVLYNPTTDQFSFSIVANEGSFYEAEKQANEEVQLWRETDHPDWKVEYVQHIGGVGTGIGPEIKKGVFHAYTSMTAKQRGG